MYLPTQVAAANTIKCAMRYHKRRVLDLTLDKMTREDMIAYFCLYYMVPLHGDNNMYRYLLARGWTPKKIMRHVHQSYTLSDFMDHYYPC